MKQFLACFLLLPVCAFAQLDRMKTNMTEQEFVKAVPEAKRDLAQETGWIGDTLRIDGIFGNRAWKIYNDTVIEYNYTTGAKDGPSQEFPSVDSAKVHALKVSADKMRWKLELQIGKPTTLRNLPLTGDNPMDISVVYLAEWVYADKSTIRISVSSGFQSGKSINAPAIRVSKNAEAYRLNIFADNRSAATRMEYCIGKSSEDFFVRYPERRGEASFLNYHHYVITDVATSLSAGWHFIFDSLGLRTFYYRAYLGTTNGAVNDAAAYRTAKDKANGILKDGNTSFGTPDTLSNTLTDQYSVHDRHVAYSVHYVNCVWPTKKGKVYFVVDEIGGGKNPATTFILNLQFENVE